MGVFDDLSAHLDSEKQVLVVLGIERGIQETRRLLLLMMCQLQQIDRPLVMEINVCAVFSHAQPLSSAACLPKMNWDLLCLCAG